MSESAGQRLARMLALVPWLAAHDGVTITEAAEHFGVSEAQLEADLWLVILCGIPGYMPDQLIDIDFWDDGRITVIEPLTLTRPLRLSPEEALTLLVALRLLAQTPGLTEGDAITSAAAKLEQAAGGQDLQRSIAVESSVDPAVASVLARADAQAVRLMYASGTDDSVTERVVEPRRMFNVDGIAYLDAYCHRAGARRTFRLDRILAAEPTTVEPTAFADASAADQGSEGGSDDPRVEVVLELAPSARWIIDVHGATSLSEDPCRVRLRAHSAEWVVRLVLSLRGAAVVQEPPALRSAVLEAARRARRRYPGA